MTGRVVGVNFIDGELTAAILTDGMNTEIQCNVGSLQVKDKRVYCEFIFENVLRI